MNSKMIEEIVPFSEKHFAIFVVALKDLGIAVCLRVLVLVNLKISSPRNCFSNLKLSEVEVIPLYYLNFRPSWDLSFYPLIGNRLVTHDLKFVEIRIYFQVLLL